MSSNKDFNTELFRHDMHMPSKTLYLTGEIDEDTYEAFSKGFHLLSTYYPNDTITIKIGSGGGCVFCGFGIYDIIASSSNPTVAVVEGQAMSMASIILQACDHRIAGPNATIMAHAGSDSVEGTPDDVRKWAKYNDKIESRILDIYANRARGLTRRTWRNRLRTEFILDAEQALKVGLIDEISQ